MKATPQINQITDESKLFSVKDFQLINVGNRFYKITTWSPNEILDIGNDHHWMLKSSGDRLMGNFVLDAPKPIDQS